MRKEEEEEEEGKARGTGWKNDYARGNAGAPRIRGMPASSVAANGESIAARVNTEHIAEGMPLALLT